MHSHMKLFQHNISSAQPPLAIVTTSWDDDAASGLEVAELLVAKGLPATFYVPTGRLGESSLLSGSNLRTLSAAGFEIGAHTVSHRILTSLQGSELTREVADCKPRLEDILGREVSTFCYPKGRFNANVVNEVKRAGYRGARSAQMLCSAAVADAYKMPTTMQAYPHHRANYVKNLVRLRAFPALVRSLPDLIDFEGWLQLGKRMFDRVLREGGVWHLFGHPWEIAKLNLWSDLREMLDYVSRREGVTYATNAQLLQPGNTTQEVNPEGVAVRHQHTVAH